MALGGYKFKGYYYRVPSDYDSSDESQVKAQCLQMFKCRLRAFIDSCSLSGAQWEFLYTEGDVSFGSYGNVIYDLDNDGYNYGSFFKYHDKDWYMILMNYQNGSSASNVFYYPQSSNNTYYDSSVYKSSCGIVAFTPSNYRSVLANRLKLRGTGAVSTNYTRSPYINNALLGFATKGCDIIETTRYPNSTRFFKVMSPDGFSSLCSPDDHCPVFDHASSGINRYSGSSSSGYVFHINYYPIQSLNDTGGHIQFPYAGSYYTDNRIPALSIFSQPEAFYAYQINRIPYAAPLITAFNYGVQDYTSSIVTLNQDGIRSKGYVKPELLSVNTPFPYTAMTGLKIFKPYAGGNYLLIEDFYVSGSDYIPITNGSNYNGAIYCGWDPSNPDITDDASFDDYVPEP